MVTEPATPSRSESVGEPARGQLPYGEEIIQPGPLNFTSLFIPFFENFLLTTAFSLIPGRREREERRQRGGEGGGRWWHERISAAGWRGWRSPCRCLLDSRTLTCMDSCTNTHWHIHTSSIVTGQGDIGKKQPLLSLSPTVHTAKLGLMFHMPQAHTHTHSSVAASQCDFVCFCASITITCSQIHIYM